MVRILYFVALGLILLAANLWFIRTAYRQFLANDYVISPFNFIDPSGQTASEKTGTALAQMMAARLQNIQSQLQATQRTGPAESAAAPANLDDPVLGATALFVPKHVDIPTNLFEPVKIAATVGGVEVGGVLSYLQNRIAGQRTIRFSTYERADRAVVSADLSQFAPSRGFLWFESDKHPDEIATNAAFALLHAKLSEGGQSRLADMTIADFRALIETVIELDVVNRRARRGMNVNADLNRLLAQIEDQLELSPDWHELVFLAASTADGLGKTGKAVLHYRNLLTMTDATQTTPRADFAATAEDRLRDLGALDAVPRTEAEERFVAAARTFARRMNLPGPEPAIAFVPHQHPGIQAVWNTEEKRYEVNPPNMTTAGLPQYVALMGRFFLKHFDRCWASGLSQPPGFSQFWNEFRYATVDYLIQSNPEFSDVKMIGSTFALYRGLTTLEADVGKEPVQRLGLLLLDRFDCDWSEQTLTNHMARIAQDDGLMPADAVRKAMSSAGLGDQDPG